MALDPVTISALSGLAGVGGGIFGNLMSAGETEEAERLARQGVDVFDNIKLPDLGKPIQYMSYTPAGVLGAETLTKTPEEMFEVAQITEDPTTRNEILESLAGIKQASISGLTLKDMLAQEDIARKIYGDSAAQRADIQRGFAEKGQRGGGAELAAMLFGAQAADDRASRENMQIAANASANQQQALRDYINGISNVRDSDYRTTQYNTDAKRLHDEFAARNSQNRQSDNARFRTDANITNFNAANQARRDTTTQTNEERYRLGHLAPQQMFSNQVGLAQNKANAYNNLANMKMGNAQGIAQNWANIGGGIANMGMGYAQMENNNRQFNKLFAAKYPNAVKEEQ